MTVKHLNSHYEIYNKRKSYIDNKVWKVCKVTFAKKSNHDRHIHQCHCQFHLPILSLVSSFFKIILLGRLLFNLALNLCYRGKLLLVCEQKLSHTTHLVKNNSFQKWFPMRIWLNRLFHSQWTYKFVLQLLFFSDLLYIHFCKHEKLSKIIYWGFISGLLFMPIFSELKRNVSFLICSVSTPKKKLWMDRD